MQHATATIVACRNKAWPKSRHVCLSASLSLPLNLSLFPVGGGCERETTLWQSLHPDCRPGCRASHSWLIVCMSTPLQKKGLHFNWDLFMANNNKNNKGKELLAIMSQARTTLLATLAIFGQQPQPIEYFNCVAIVVVAVVVALQQHKA